MSARLQKEVWGLERCSGCGVCVAVCSKGVLYWDGEQHPLLEERQKALGLSHLTVPTCVVCDRFCELSCPRLADPVRLGTRRAVSARSAGVVQSGLPNDIVQALLVAARAANLIDGVIMPDLDPWTLQPIARIATTIGEIVSGVGMQYLWAPLLSALNEAIFEHGLERLAIVGTPCMAEGAHRLRLAANGRLWPYQKAIRLTIASFCTGMYNPVLIPELLEKGLGVPRHQVRTLQTSVGDAALGLTLWDGTERSLPLTELGPFTRRGCAHCADYLGESADIAVGTVGALPGHATLIARTAGGEAVLENACNHGLLASTARIDTPALEAARVAKDRRARAEAFAGLRILMLDALGDARKQAEVKERFARLYGEPQIAASKKREATNDSCSRCSCSGC